MRPRMTDRQTDQSTDRPAAAQTQPKPASPGRRPSRNDPTQYHSPNPRSRARARPPVRASSPACLLTNQAEDFAEYCKAHHADPPPAQLLLSKSASVLSTASGSSSASSGGNGKGDGGLPACLPGGTVATPPWGVFQ